MLPGSMRPPTNSKRFGRIRQRREGKEGNNCPDETKPLGALHGMLGKPMIESPVSNTMFENNRSFFDTPLISKTSVTGWMKQVLRKENASPTSYKKPSLFRKKGRIRKTSTDASDGRSSPTNSRTVTDESSSQTYNTRNDDTPHFKSLAMSMDESYPDHNLSPNDAYQNNTNTVDDTTGESSCLPLTPISFDVSSEEESNHNDELQKCHFDKSEIISMLFPLGYPSAQTTENASDGKKTDLIGRDDVEVTEERVENSAEACQEEITNKSPFSRSEIARFLFPFGHPEETKCNTEPAETNASRTELEPTEFAEIDYEDTGSTSSDSNGGDCDEVLGSVVCFDPTWELLTQGPDETDPTATMVRSRLRKFYEVENYSNSILGKFTEEEASQESSDIVADVNVSFGTESCSLPLGSHLEDFVMESTSPNNSFELGYHFDLEQFPVVDSSEVEICFYSDEESIDYDQDSQTTEQQEAWTREIEQAMVSEQLAFLSNMDESQDDILHFNDSDSMDTIEGEIIFMNESMDYCSSDSDYCSQVSTETRLNPLLFLEHNEQIDSPQKLFLFTDKDDNDSTGWDSSSVTSTDISSLQLLERELNSLHIPQLWNAC